MRLVGIDLGGTKIEGIVLEEDGSEVFRKRIPTESRYGYEHVCERIRSLFEQLAPHAPGLRRVGVGTPGSTSARTGLLKNSNTTCLNGRPLRSDLERRLGVEVLLENDANCFALAEALLGAGRGADVVFGVILGTGVGGGIVWRGRVWPGHQHVAGEWGHHRISDDGPLCYCGHRGCVETFLSGPAFEKRYAERSGERLDLPEIVTRARSGDRDAEAVLEEYLRTFGRALANVVNILDPDCIVLGGGVSNVEELYTRGVEEVRRYVFNDEFRTPVVRHALGDSAGVIGAALLAGDEAKLRCR